MKLKELVKKLSEKPNQNEEVEFFVYEKKNGDIVCIEMAGSDTTKIIALLAKRKNP